MLIRIKIKTAEEFLNTNGICVSDGRIYNQEDDKADVFSSTMKEIMGKSFDAEELDIRDDFVQVYVGNDWWAVEPWMCSIWQEEEHFDYFELVEVKDRESDEWSLRYFVEIEENEQPYKYKATAVGKDVYETFDKRRKDYEDSYWRYIRKIKII